MTSPAMHALRPQVALALAEMPTSVDYAAVLQRRMRWFMVWQLADFGVLLFCPWRWLVVTCAAVFAVYRARTVWTIVHNRVHAKPLPHSPSKWFYDFSTGFVAIWWRRHHLQHHAHTNTARDPDTRMYLGVDLRDAKPGLARTILQYPFLFVLFFYRSLSSYRDGSAWWFLGAMAAYGVLLKLMLPADVAALNTGLNMGLGTAYIVFTFAPTHTAHRGNMTLSDDGQLNQLIASNDVWPQYGWWSWLCGGINLHIEHHLFPNVPSDWLPRVAPVVSRYAAEHQLSYNAFSPWGLWRRHLNFLAGE
jgi:fatty acid desaturase